MRRTTALLAATAALALPVALAAPAAAEDDERTCYSVNNDKLDTFEVCIFLPVEPEIGS